MTPPINRKNYTVRWEIEVDANSPREACENAIADMRSITLTEDGFNGPCSFTAIEHPNDVRTFIDLKNAYKEQDE